MTCESQPRMRYNDPGWTCDGTGLVTVLHVGMDGKRLPVVCPADRVAALTADGWGEFFQPEPFAGGDHAHIVLPTVPPTG